MQPEEGEGAGPRTGGPIDVKILRARDPCFGRILFISRHVVAYRFCSGAWQKPFAEGPLYIYRRHAIPSVAVLLLNRKSPQDLRVELGVRLVGYEAHPDFLVAKIEAAPRATAARERGLEVLGFWFHSTRELEAVQGLFAEAHRRQERSRDLALKLKELAGPERARPASH